VDDLTLLRKYEPVVRFSHGELFFPCAVDEYLNGCSLWRRDPKGNEEQVVAAGALSAQVLARYSEVPANHTLYLRFINAPLEPLEFQRWLLRSDKPIFRAPGRLARVGLLSRVLDSLFTLSLVVRGTVPGGTAAAAEIRYRQISAVDPRRVYYGRVIREGGYLVLHYLFFYVMNNWRSGFYGVNDHEADWEQVFIYLSQEAKSEPVPRWVACATHESGGDDFRRRWDDPDLHKVQDNHPVIYAGAGSHASYFLPGEYLMGIEPNFFRPVKNGLRALRRFWVEQLGQGRNDQVGEAMGAMLRVPFIDYARGDGLAIGPGQNQVWSPIVLTPELGWVEQYRGLWGLDTRDPFGGERAPAGPKFNRDGSVRTTWYDPLGWAGLDKVTPAPLVPAHLRQHIATLSQERETIGQLLAQKREAVRRLALEVQALQATAYGGYLGKNQQKKLDEAQQELQTLYAQYTTLNETCLASQAYLEKIEAGDWGDPQAHLRQAIRPQPPVGRQVRLREWWGAVSAGLLLAALTLLLLFAPEQWFLWTILIGTVFVTIEATVHGRLANLLLNVTIVLAVITSIILIKDFWWLIIILALFGLVITTILENLQELGGRKR
jgi:hypothetical protein